MDDKRGPAGDEQRAPDRHQEDEPGGQSCGIEIEHAAEQHERRGEAPSGEHEPESWGFLAAQQRRQRQQDRGVDEAVARPGGGEIETRGIAGEEMARGGVSEHRGKARQRGDQNEDALHGDFPLAAVVRRRRARYKSPAGKCGQGESMPSFDIVSRLDLAEVENAVAGLMREIATRFDFKGAKSSVELQEGALLINADDELKLKQIHELLKVHTTRRKVDPGMLDFKPPEKAAGQSLRQTVTLRQGIDATLAKRVAREIKDSKLKVQASIQGDELRVTAKKRDDLQAAIALLRGLKLEQPLQYVNFRE